MRTLAAAFAALFLLSAPLAAQAGEGCGYSKDKAVTASLDAPQGDLAHHGSCAEACTGGKASASTGDCVCGEEATTASEKKASETPGATVAATD